MTFLTLEALVYNLERTFSGNRYLFCLFSWPRAGLATLLSPGWSTQLCYKVRLTVRRKNKNLWKVSNQAQELLTNSSNEYSYPRVLYCRSKLVGFAETNTRSDSMASFICIIFGDYSSSKFLLIDCFSKRCAIQGTGILTVHQMGLFLY